MKHQEMWKFLQQLLPETLLDDNAAARCFVLDLTYSALQDLNGRKTKTAEAAGGKPGLAASIAADAENEARLAAMVCSLKNKDECLMCGS